MASNKTQTYYYAMLFHVIDSPLMWKGFGCCYSVVGDVIQYCIQPDEDVISLLFFYHIISNFNSSQPTVDGYQTDEKCKRNPLSNCNFFSLTIVWWNMNKHLGHFNSDSKQKKVMLSTVLFEETRVNTSAIVFFMYTQWR